MKSIKRGIATFLAALLLIPNVPVHAGAESLDGGGGAPDIVQYNTGNGICTVMEAMAADLPKEPELPVEGADSVTGSAVDADGEGAGGADPAEDGENVMDGGDTAAGFFAEDGSYTIPIPEVDPFFPYEVQFTYNGNVTNEWFMTPGDSVEIGGHTFYVSAEFTGTVVTQMSMEVAGDIVTVYPVEKEFPEQGAAGYSLLPLEEKSLQIDLEAYTPMELSMVKIATIFAGETEFTDTNKIIWSYSSNGDDFTVSTSGGTVDMRNYSSYQMIVGNDDQLDASNTRYIIWVDKISMDDWLVADFYTQNYRERAQIVPWNPSDASYYDSSYVSEDRIRFLTWVPDLGNEDNSLRYTGIKDSAGIYVGLKLNPEKFSNIQFDHIKVYEGEFQTLEDVLKGQEITEEIWEKDMTQRYQGYFVEFQESMSSSYAYSKDQDITLVTFDAFGNPTGFHSLSLDFDVYSPDFGAFNPLIYAQDENAGRKPVKVNSSSYYNQEILTWVSEDEVKDANTLYIGSESHKKLCTEFHCDHIEVYEGSCKTVSDIVYSNKITNQIWNDNMQEINSGYPIPIRKNQFSASTDITFVAYDEGNSMIWMYPTNYSIYAESGGISINSPKNEQGDYIVSSYNYIMEDGIYVEIQNLYADYEVDAEYFQRLGYRNSYGKEDNNAVLGAYVGIYETMEEAESAGVANIKDQLFGSEGYKANYSKTVYFTVFVQESIAEGEQPTIRTYHRGILMQDSGRYKHNLSNATSLSFDGLRNAQGETVDCFIVNAEEDSYAEFNYLTILVDKDVDLAKIAPVFRVYPGSKLYAAGSITAEISGQSSHDFSNGPVQYTVSSEDGRNSKNYWLQIVKASETEKSLYVNSLVDPDAKRDGIRSIREMMIDGYHNDIHDILLINMGVNVVTGAAVELVSDTVELDDYWTLKGNLSLSGFDGTEKKEPHGELSNMAKIRLRRKEGIAAGAEIGGVLTVKSDTEDLFVFELTGIIGDPSITTTDIPPAIKYVPYGTMIQNSNKYSWNQVRYSLYSGQLPDGIVLKPNGELYGVPKKTGTFRFMVRMENNGSYYNFISSYKEFTLEVKENTDENVDAATDEGYDVTTRIPTLYLGEKRQNQIFVSAGNFIELVDVYLDGAKLERDVDYTAESGSTRITIMAETLDEGVDEGTHTIGVEFRTEEDDSLKKAAQNFEVKRRNSMGGGTGSGGTGGGSIGNFGTPTPTAIPEVTMTPTPQISVTPTPTMPVTPTPTIPATPTPRPTSTPKPTSTPVPVKRPDAGVPFVKNDMDTAGWDAIKTQTKNTADGESIVIDMNDATVVPGEIVEAVTGKDVTLRFEMEKDIAWEVNGNSVTSKEVGDIDFQVQTGEDANEIPVEVINNVTGERSYINLRVAYDGTFGFTAVLCINLGRENAGLYANLFYYNKAEESMEFICAGRINKAGNVKLSFTHASDYVVVIDKKAMEQTDDAGKEDEKNEDKNPVSTNDKDLPKTALKDSVWFLFAGMLVILAGGFILLIAYDKRQRQDE